MTNSFVISPSLAKSVILFFPLRLLPWPLTVTCERHTLRRRYMRFHALWDFDQRDYGDVTPALSYGRPIHPNCAEAKKRRKEGLRVFGTLSSLVRLPHLIVPFLPP